MTLRATLSQSRRASSPRSLPSRSPSPQISVNHSPNHHASHAGHPRTTSNPRIQPGAPLYKRLTLLGLAKAILKLLPEQLKTWVPSDPVLYTLQQPISPISRLFLSLSIPLRLKYMCLFPDPPNLTSSRVLWRQAFDLLMTVSAHLLKHVPSNGGALRQDLWAAFLDCLETAFRYELPEDALMKMQDLEEDEALFKGLRSFITSSLMPLLADSSAQRDRLLTRLYQSVIHAIQDAGRSLRILVPYPKTLESKYQRHVKQEEKRTVSLDDLTDPAIGVDVSPIEGHVISYVREKLQVAAWTTLIHVLTQSYDDHARELCFPLFVTSVRSVLLRYVEDKKTFGNYPIPRIQQDEVIFLLQSLHDLVLPVPNTSTPDSNHHRTPYLHFISLYPTLVAMMTCKDDVCLVLLQRIFTLIGARLLSSP